MNPGSSYQGLLSRWVWHLDDFTVVIELMREVWCQNLILSTPTVAIMGFQEPPLALEIHFAGVSQRYKALGDREE